MGRGFLTGLFWGGIVAVGMLLVSSQALDRQSLSLPKPQATSVEVPGGSEFDQAGVDTDPAAPEPETRPEAEAATLVEAPDDAVEEAPSFETSTLEVPTPSVGKAGELTDAPETTAAPEAPAASEEARPDDSSADLPMPEAPGDAPETGDDAPRAVAAPEAEDDEPTTPQSGDAPSGTEVAALPEAGAEVTGETETGNAPSVTTDDTAPAAMVAPSLGEEPSLPGPSADAESAPRLPQLTEPAQPSGDATAPEISVAPDAPPAPELGEEDAPGVGDDAPEAEEEAPVVVETTPSNETEAPAQEEKPSLLEKVETIDDKADDVETDRLPRVSVAEAEPDSGGLPAVRRFGDNSADSEDTPELAEDTSEDAIEPEPKDGPAIRVFGAEFVNPEGNPLLSLVLVQEGDAVIGEAEMASLPPAVAFAIQAGGDSAGSLAAFYRSAGREVVLIPSLPAGAAPQDVEQALRVNFDTLPEAVAIMDVSGSSFQSDRGAVQQVVDVVSATGHGMITFPRGLNTAHQSAERAGVPAGLIFRQLDGNGESAEQIRRTLDRAAFRARPDEAVILVGTTASETLAAISEWVSGNRAKSVTLAPISAALLNE